MDVGIGCTVDLRNWGLQLGVVLAIAVHAPRH